MELNDIRLVVRLEADLGQMLPYVSHVKCPMVPREFALVAV